MSTKPQNRKYFLCIEDEGEEFIVKAKRRYSCGSSYYATDELYGSVVLGKEDPKEFLIVGQHSAEALRKSFTARIRKQHPRGQRPRIYTRRIMGKEIENLKPMAD